MTRNLALVIGAAAAGIAAFAISRALNSRTTHAAGDRQVDDASEDSFPASDAPSHTPMVGGQIVN